MDMITADTSILLAMILALGAGAISFLSPCVLPLFPAYLSYITGISTMELQDQPTAPIRRKLLSHSIVFLLGIAVIFMSLGAGSTFIGQWGLGLLTGNTGMFIQQIAGILIVFMGFLVGGWLQIPGFMRERRLQISKSGTSYAGTFVVGIGFAAGWTPCIGPIFASILLLSAAQPAQGMVYTALYVLGFSIPFLLLTFFIGSTKWLVRKSGWIIKAGGAIMIIMGLLLFFGQMPKFAAYLLELIDDTWFSKLG
ncbi:cytochrome c biogenesis CcdA family protein [Bhargavaea beijingensis]|uniref:cytochrome c biogenesis CcdA family protein n=1 Tax=Bhargavaea beijingensis TaxID=426756 RepID=UPI002224AE7D|nr:cytochrome c biogenesis protein CcdA [Bhargavaea beijingensis]MCW1927493.1 cytochrome c biogenesis protein CcdA [Bhargavaea beijingensis]